MRIRNGAGAPRLCGYGLRDRPCSGCHLNLAVSVGLAMGGRFPMREVVPYVVAQVLGATIAAFLLYFIASGKADFTLAANSLAVSGYGELSPGKYSLSAGFVTEVAMTAMFLFVILGATDKRAPAVSAGLEWLEQTDAGPVVHQNEPSAGLWRHLLVPVLSILPVEPLL